MQLSQLAVQLYTVRDYCRTARELAATAEKIREIGFSAVQLSGIGPIPEEEIVAIMSAEGLAICATHEPPADILERPAVCAKRLQKLGCQLTAFPWPAQVDFSHRVEVKRLAGKLDAAGAVLRQEGVRLAYHNHAIEFTPIDGMTALEYIYCATAPENVAAELDTYWLHRGGGDVVEWCQRMRGRLPLIHLKDYTTTANNEPIWCEVGAGVLDWPAIIAAADQAGCAWYIVEQDTCPGNPFTSLQQSFDFVVTRLID